MRLKNKEPIIRDIFFIFFRVYAKFIVKSNLFSAARNVRNKITGSYRTA